jgi:nucleoside-diphosphate-sugar epimerase
MNVLITGTTGFLGKELVNQLSANAIFKLNRNIGDYHCDLSKSTPSFQNSFDLVIHNAGKAHSVPRTNVEIENFFKVNVVGTENLLKGLEISIPRQIVFISSVSVYGLDQGSNIKESSILLAKDPYGESKILAEKLVQEWCKRYNVVCTILRLPLVVGANPLGNLGSMIRGIEKGYYFNIGGGKARKSMVLAEDVAKFIVKVAAVGGTYNLTDGYHPSFSEFSSLIARQLGKSKVYNLPLWIARIVAFFGDKLGDKFPLNSNKLNKISATLTFDDTKAREAFGWSPTCVLDGFKVKA